MVLFRVIVRFFDWFYDALLVRSSLSVFGFLIIFILILPFLSICYLFEYLFIRIPRYLYHRLRGDF